MPESVNPDRFYVALNPDNGWVFCRPDQPGRLAEVQVTGEWPNRETWVSAKATPVERVKQCILYAQNREQRAVGEVVRLVHAGRAYECTLLGVPSTSGVNIMGQAVAARIPYVLRDYPATYTADGLLDGMPGGYLDDAEKVQ